MGYTHVNAQFQLISIHILKDNCAFSTSQYAASRMSNISRMKQDMEQLQTPISRSF